MLRRDPASLSHLELKCVQAGLKMTEQRRVIVAVLEQAADHPSVEDLYMRARTKDSSISLATVYRTLSLLDEMGLVQKHDFKENHARFETNLDHHHHMIDVESGDVIEFQDEELELLKVRIAERLGFELVDHRLELYGRRLKRT